MASFVNLSKLCGNYMATGLAGTLYLVPESEILVWPDTRKQVVEAAAGTPAVGDEKIFDEPFEFVTTSGIGYWRSIPILYQNSDLLDVIEGDQGGLKYVQRLSFQIQGSTSERLSFADCLLSLSGCMVPMIADKNGLWHVLARKDFPAQLENGEGGPGGERNGFNFTLYNEMGLTHMLYDADTHGVDITPNP